MNETFLKFPLSYLATCKQGNLERRKIKIEFSTRFLAEFSHSKEWEIKIIFYGVVYLIFIYALCLCCYFLAHKLDPAAVKPPNKLTHQEE